MTRARSLSLLANSNIFTVDQSNSRVGIGSTIPDVKLDVDGDMNVTGTLTYEDVTNVETAGITTTGGLVVTGLGATIGGITTFFGDLNFGAAGVGGTITTLGHAEFAGIVTATSFSGDGSGLTGVASTDNINTSTLAQFTGGVGIADSIFHIDDSNTAIRFPANDTFTVETAGSERLRITSGGNVNIGGEYSQTDSKVIIVDASRPIAEATLNLQSSTTSGAVDTGPVLRFYGHSGSEGRYHASIKGAKENGTSGNTAGYLALNTRPAGGAMAERLRITSAGDVGIGDQSPDTKLDVREDAGNPAIQLCSSHGGADTYSSLRFKNLTASAVADLKFITNSSVYGDIQLAYESRGSERFRVDQDGRFLIGTTNAVAFGSRRVLAVANGTTGAVLSLYNSTTATNNPRISSNPGGSEINDIGIHAASTNGTIQFYTSNDTERLRIASSGQIGLGGANYGTAGQAIVSNGSGSAPTWQDVASGISTQAGTASGIVTSMFLTDATDHKVTATGICTITTTQAGTEGESHTIRIVNSGIATVGFSTYFLFPSGSAPSLPTTSGAVSLISFTVHDSVGAGCTQLLAGASVNFS